MKPTLIKFSIYLYGCQIISYCVSREKNKSQKSEDKIVSSIEYIVYSEEKEDRTGIKI